MHTQRGPFYLSTALFIAFTVIFGGLYPAAVTLVAQVAFPKQSEGSLIVKDGKVMGSELIGQNFSNPKYFWGRLSATSPAYNASSSSGSNMGASNPALLDAVKGRMDALKKADPDNDKPIPVDLVTASGSGLDPHISPAAAEYQAGRVAHERGLGVEAVKTLIKKHTEGRQFGLLGEERVNVLMLNLDLDGKL
jgi:K+-transporting ATPase ATPase C chain